MSIKHTRSKLCCNNISLAVVYTICITHSKNCHRRDRELVHNTNHTIQAAPSVCVQPLRYTIVNYWATS